MEGLRLPEVLGIVVLDRVSSAANCVSVSSLVYSNGASKLRTASIGSITMCGRSTSNEGTPEPYICV